MACSVCENITHNKGAHIQSCGICGADATVVKRLQDINYDYRCRDVELHDRIRSGFGDPKVIKIRDTVVRAGKETQR